MGETHTRRDTKEIEVGAMKLTREIYDGTRGMSPLADILYGSLTMSRLIRTSSASQLPPWEAVVTYCSVRSYTWSLDVVVGNESLLNAKRASMIVSNC
jgi:hypothetical protein